MTKSSRPSFFRLLAVMFYDSLILLSLLFFASLVAVIFNNGEAISQGNLFFIVYLLAVSWLFYCWFWTHGGQTIGMRAWKVYLLNKNGAPLTWQQASVRFGIALLSWVPFGLGFWWQYLGQAKQSWADALSGTYLHYENNSAK